LKVDLENKRALMDKATTMISASELRFRMLKEKQVQRMYNPSM
jgi:hypothetical protein